MWMAGHQPVINFHTGLLAKIWRVAQENQAVWLVHDLDTIAEDGAIAVKIPTREGKMASFRSLSSSGLGKDKLFCAGPVVASDLAKEILQRLAGLRGKIVSRYFLDESERRLQFLMENFFGQDGVSREWPSIAHLNHRILMWLLPKLNIQSNFKTIYLSEFLTTEECREWLVRNALDEECWLWDKEQCERSEILHYTKDLIEDGVIIPKAVALSRMVRDLGYVSVGGIGQAQYDKEAGIDTGIIVTSRQGMPNPWSRVFPVDFRPSALLLFVVGGAFDVDLVECR